ncbi:MAG: hypothetical protein QM535_21250 [Limnohabitans sp.]|nr:hypothetical protein [Limnohabitans sp.]
MKNILIVLLTLLFSVNVSWSQHQQNHESTSKTEEDQIKSEIAVILDKCTYSPKISATDFSNNMIKYSNEKTKFIFHGATMTREQLLNDVKNGNIKVTKNDESNQEINVVNKNLVLVTKYVKLNWIAFGKPMSSEVTMSDVFYRSGEGWKLLLRQTSRLK